MENVTGYVVYSSINSTFPSQEPGMMGLSLVTSNIGGVFYISINFIIVIAIISGNFLVVESFRTEHSLRKSGTNMILFSLAVTDLLTGAIGLPLHVTGRILVSPLTCSSVTRALFFLPGFFFCGLSLAHILFLAVERYVYSLFVDIMLIHH